MATAAATPPAMHSARTSTKNALRGPLFTVVLSYGGMLKGVARLRIGPLPTAVSRSPASSMPSVRLRRKRWIRAVSTGRRRSQCCFACAFELPFALPGAHFGTAVVIVGVVTAVFGRVRHAWPFEDVAAPCAGRTSFFVGLCAEACGCAFVFELVLATVPCAG